jgi:ribonuclease VapC
MVLDTSAIISILLQEPGSEHLIGSLGRSPIVIIGAPTVAETAIVLSAKLKRDAKPIVDGFLREAEVEVIPFSREHYEVAVEAFQRYGKGRHPASLNFGDCLTYAIAYLAQLPLLATGNDFPRTDLKMAQARA